MGFSVFKDLIPALRIEVFVSEVQYHNMHDVPETKKWCTVCLCKSSIQSVHIVSIMGMLNAPYDPMPICAWPIREMVFEISPSLTPKTKKHAHHMWTTPKNNLDLYWVRTFQQIHLFPPLFNLSCFLVTKRNTYNAREEEKIIRITE